MNNSRLYLSILPDNAQALVSEYRYRALFEAEWLFERYNPDDFEELLKQIRLFCSFNFSFLNTINNASRLYEFLFLANYNSHMTCLQIRHKLQEILPAAEQARISDSLLHLLKIRFYTPEELRLGLRHNHYKMAEEYLEYTDTQRIQKLDLDARDLATWQLIKLMRPPFETDQSHPLEIKISKRKDRLIAPQVAQLLSQGAYPKAYCYKEIPLLTCAAAWRMPLVAELLLKAGADPNDRPCPLWFAKGAKVAKVLLSHGADPDIQTTDGRVALVPFCLYSSIGKVRALLEAGADPNIAQTDGRRGWTPLIHYMFRLTRDNNLEILKLLLDWGADRTVQIEAYGGHYGDKKMITAEDIARNQHAGKQKWKAAVKLLSKPQKIT
jgi:hypothetical protein